MGTTNQKLTKAAKIKVAKTMREYGENMLKVKQREMPKRNMRATNNKTKK